MNSEQRYAGRIPSPVGDLWIVVDAAGVLLELNFEGGRSAPADEDDLVARAAREGAELTFNVRRVAAVARALKAYFQGRLRQFDLPVAPAGTSFQQAVWRELQRIPWGQTISYGELARRVGRPGAARAVGGANGSNPVAVVIPCHRVIGTDGSLTGYGGGMQRKVALLELEGALPARLFPN